MPLAAWQVGARLKMGAVVVGSTTLGGGGLKWAEGGENGSHLRHRQSAVRGTASG